MKTAHSTSTLRTGFTMIELLIVIAILAVLTTIIIFVPLSGTKKARDARRQSDIKQYQTALELYASKNSSGFYPSRTGSGSGVSAPTTLCSDLGLTNCPQDPLNSQDTSYAYMYQSNGSSNGTLTGTMYRIWAKQEAGNFFLVCSNGKSGTMPLTWTPGGGAGSCPL